MLLRIPVAVALVLASVTAASADEPTLLDMTISTCVGSGFGIAPVSYDVIAGLPEENCVRACKAAGRGCKAVVRAVDRCGASFLRAAAKTEMEICRGLGGTSQECRGVKDIVKADIAWWKAAGKVEQADCDADTETLCMARCQLAPRVSGLPLSPPPIPIRVSREGEAGGASVTLQIYDQLLPSPMFGSQQGGGAGFTSGAIEYLGAPLVDESPEGEPERP